MSIPDQRVLLTGVFDIITRGHVRLIVQASLYGTRLIVGLNDDASVRALKGESRPINNEMDRKYVMEHIQHVNEVFLIRSTNVADAIRRIRPFAWVKSNQYTLETLNQEEVVAAKEVGAEIVLLPHLDGYSTTETLRKLEIKDEHRTVL